MKKKRKKAYLVTTFIGVFAIDEKNKILAYESFPKNPEKIAEKLRLSERKTIEEERLIEKRLKKKLKDVEIQKAAENDFIRNNLRKLAIEYKFVKNQAEFNRLLTKVNVALTKEKIKAAIGRDSLVVQCNRAIEEIDRTINILIERLREWYGLHFPEMERVVENHEKFAKTINRYGLRKNVKETELAKLKEKSMGIEFTEEDVKAVQSLATELLELYKLRKNLSKYLDKILKEIAPNFTAIAGSTLAAKLIAKAGSLEKIARMPSSTLQLLGAEKALFRHLHGRGKAPKFGILFSHPLIQSTPQKHRGKVARAIASKLSIAAKMDFYSKKREGERMKKELKERIKGIIKSK